jgi:choline dehydrogenase-like flavoprotein
MVDADVVVIGSGAAGGWAAKTLTEQGAKVLILEAGPLIHQDHRVDRALYKTQSQPEQRHSTAYSIANAHIFVNDIENPYSYPLERPFMWYRSRQLGGRLLLWAGVCLRLSPRELELAENGDGRWPLDYGELAPYYDEVESFMWVTGDRECSPAAPNPCAVGRSRFTAGEKQLAGSLSRWKHRRLLSARVAHRPVGALLESALKTGNLSIRPNAVVTHLKTSKSRHRVSSVAFRDTLTGEDHDVAARSVVLAASTIETIRILFSSTSSRHPQGLGNSNGQLGQYILDHTAGISLAGTVPVHQRRHTLNDPGFVPVTHIPDFSADEGRSGFRGGFGITAFVPEVVPLNERSRQWISRVEGDNESVFRMWGSGEVMPNKNNRVTLGSRRDRWGVPVANIDFSLTDEDRTMGRAQFKSMMEISKAAGFTAQEASFNFLPPGSSVHELGGARMGNDPAVSTVDPWNRLWDVPNVHVVDGACFPRAGWQNPTLTIMALSLRACRKIADDLTQ